MSVPPLVRRALVWVLVSLVAAAGPLAGGVPDAGAEEDEPALSVSDATIVEGDEPTTTMWFTVALSEPLDEDVAFDATTDFGRDPSEIEWATPDADYLPYAARRIVIPAGATEAMVDVQVIGDDSDESDESVILWIRSATADVVTDRWYGLGTIVDDDEGPLTPVPSLSVDDATADEQLGMLSFPVRVSEPVPHNIVATYRITGGTATFGADYDERTGQVWIPAGATDGELLVDLMQDQVEEQTETIELQLSAHDGATIADGSAVGTITDDDAPMIYMTGGTVHEDASYTVVVVRTATPPRYGPITVGYETRPGTAGADDFTATSGTVTIPVGGDSAAFVVWLTDDTIDEPDETFDAAITSVTGGRVHPGDDVGTVTILDDDEPVVPDIAVADAFAYEDDGAITFTISLSQATTVPVTVDYVTGDSTSSNGARHHRDFLYTSGRATFAPGETTIDVAVPLVDDLVPELNEGFRLVLEASAGGVIVDRRANGTIADDDPVRLGSVL
jgi:hypothetical protein